MTELLTGWTSLWDLIEQRAAATPDAKFAIDEHEQSLTYAEYRDAANRAAAGLAALGVGEGTNVSWELPTWIESMVLVGALARLGAVQNPMLPIYREREVRFITQQTNAKLLIVPSVWRGFDYEDMARTVAADTPGLEVLVCDKTLPDGDPSTLGPPAPGAAEPFQPGVATDGPWRWIFYTSGTTVDPKGARHTDKTVGASAYTMDLVLEMSPEDRNAMVFPFTHIGGIGWLFASLMGGYVHVLVESFVPVTTIPVLQRESVTIAGAGTAFHLAYLTAQREQPGQPIFPDARAFVGGGAAKPPALHYEVKEELGGVGIVSGYGLTEVPILAMAGIHDPDQKLADTEGRAGPGVEVKVVKLDGGLAGPGEEGEIRAKGPNLMLGYVDASLDADAFDDEGFFRSGDLGNLDAEGYIAITGRLKDVIIRKGENISAKEVEDLLFTSPQVADAAVIGLPDPRSGERACAVIVAADPENPPTLADLFEFLKGEGLMVQKIPEQLILLDVLPRNPTGKVLKHELRKQYADEVAHVPLNEEQLALAARVSNWGRWGADDQRGTLNLIDDVAVRRGAAAVRRGVSFSLSIPMHTDGPQTGRVMGRENPKRTVTVASFAFTGDSRDFQTSDDKLETGLQSATHWDSLAHAGYDDLLFNGVPSSAITMEDGATRLGIEQFGPVVTRGILCDIARLKGVDWFDEPYAITGGDLDACVTDAGLSVEPGDVILVRTNQMHWLREGNRERYADISPGVGVGALQWLHDNDIAAIATDTHTFEPYPGEGDNPFLFPVHMIELRDMGIPQGQQWALDELAADCAADGVYEFLLCATPLPVVGGLGGLVAPTATK